MKIFTLNGEYSIVCNFVSTRNGFKHTASLCKGGNPVYQTKICYINRTWETFEYASILAKVISENFNGAEKQKFLEVLNVVNG
jgi:hypothetical protein